MSEKGRWLDAKYYEWELLFGDNKTHLIFAEWMYAQALSDAKAAVRLLERNVPTTHFDYKFDCAIGQAIAAIRALEEK